jgi:membrane protein
LLAAGFGNRSRQSSEANRDDPGREASGFGRHESARRGERNDSGRGRSATTPSEIPARGWKDIVLRVYKNISAHRILAISAGVTFYSLLSIFPALAAFVSVYGLFADTGSIASHLDQLATVLPAGAIDVIRDQMTRVASKGHGSLGVTFLVSLVAALWSANAAIKAMFDALNIVYAEDEKRGFIKLNAVSLAFTSGAIVFMLLAAGATVIVPAMVDRVGLGDLMQVIIRIMVWPVLFVILAIGLALIYRYGPSRDRPRWRWISWGSTIAVLGWLIASILFSWYAANFGKFNETYGSLGAVIGFMTWMWISAIVVLVGAELNAEMEHQTARDTTVGRPEPMGRRRARMADSVGAAQGRS